jgi:hypothetical protein
MRSRSSRLTAPVQFEAATHTYSVRGTEVDSVSQLLREAGLVSVSHYSVAGRDRGSRVHAAAEAVDRGVSGLPLPREEQGYLDSYLQWSALVAAAWERIESPQYSVVSHFAGTADRIGTIGRHPERSRVVVDLKSGSPQRWHGLQLALYDLLYASRRVPPMTRRRVCVYLRRDGRCAQSVTFSDDRDYHVIQQVLDARAPKET